MVKTNVTFYCNSHDKEKKNYTREDTFTLWMDIKIKNTNFLDYSNDDQLTLGAYIINSMYIIVL